MPPINAINRPARLDSRLLCSTLLHGNRSQRAVIGLAMIGGAFAGAHPTGSPIADVVLTSLIAGLVAAMSGFAPRWSWLVLATTATLMAHSASGWLLGGAGLAMTLYAVLLDARSMLMGQVVGAISVVALLIGESTMPVELSAALGVGPCLLTLLSGYARAPEGVRRRLRVSGAACISVSAAAIVLYAVTAASTRASADQGLAALAQGIDAARAGDRSATIDALHRAGDALHSAKQGAGSLPALPALALPGIGPNVAAVKVAIDEGQKLTDQALATALQVDPDHLRARGGSVDIAAIRAAQGPFARMVQSLEDSRARLNEVRSPWLVAPIDHRIDVATKRIDAMLPGARAALDTSIAAFSLLGGDRPAHFLVLFVTPVEARGSGFPGNYAQVDISAGHISLKRFGRTSDLSAAPDGPPRTLVGPTDFIARYSRFGGIADFYNVTFSPDLPTVANVYRDLYPQAGGDPIDGVIRIDPAGLAALLRYTGPIAVSSAPEPLTHENAADYLLRQQYVTFAQAEDNRVDALDDIGHATFERLTKADLPGPQQLARDLAPVVAGQHLSVYAFDPAAQRVLDRAGLSGRLPQIAGDQVGVIVNNLGGNKIDLFLERKIEHRVDWEPATGQITTTTTVWLHNSAAASGLPDRVVGTSLVAAHRPDHRAPPSGTNRMFLSIYGPWFPASVQVDGTANTAQIEDEGGRKVASLVLDIPAGDTRMVTITSSGKLPAGKAYRLDIWRQSLAMPGSARVVVVSKEGPQMEKNVALDRNVSLTLLAH